MSDCVKRIVEKSNGLISQSEARELLSEVDRIATRKARTTGDKDQAIEDVLTERAQRITDNIEKQKINTLRNIKVRKELENRFEKNFAEGGDERQAVQSLLVGTQRNLTGGRYSIDAQQIAKQALYFGRMTGQLIDDDLLEIFNTNVLRRETIMELEAITKKDGKPGITGSKEAKRIAEIIHETQSAMRDELNALGADIGELDGFILTQTHDTVKMRKMGKEEWIRTIRPLLDENRTFGDSDPDEFLGAAYDNLLSGKRPEDTVAGVKDPKLFQFSGPANLGKKLSRSRSLHFKSGEDFIRYNDALGTRDFNEGIISSIEFGAKNIALMENLGSNPRAMLDSVLDRMISKRKMDKRDANKLRNAADNFYAEISGESMMAVNDVLANRASAVRVVQSVSKLGGATLSATADVPMVAMELQYQGKNIFSSYADAFKGAAAIFQNSKERQRFASMVGVGMDGMIADVGARFSSTDAPIGKLSKLQRLFFKLNGLQRWTDSNKKAMGSVMSHALAQESGLPWSKLSDTRKQLFKFYDIGESDWDVIRQAKRRLEGDDKDFIFAQDIADSAVATKLQAYYSDRVNHGVITGGARERAIWNLGTKRGTPEGEALRFLAQFKQFPTTVITRVWGRTLMSKGKADVPMFAQMLIMSGIFGYIAGAAKDVVKGREPKDPLMKETIMASFLQGGGAGILGDFFFADANRYGGGVLATLAGPTVGTVEDAWQAFSALYYKQDPDMAASQTLRLIQSNTPFANLFYIKPALDNLMMYHIHEELNPGYLRRMERRLKKDFNQDTLF